MKWLAPCALVACQQSTPTPPPPPPMPKHVTADMKELAARFSPEYVGVVAPRSVVAGSYSMALEMSFNVFETRELEITEHRHGALMLTLAADGNVTGCIASRGDQGAAGQREYERDPAKRQPYRGTKDAKVGAVHGRWTAAIRESATQEIATVSFDQITWGSCAVPGEHDPAVGSGTTQKPTVTPISPLRCIATAKTSLLPEGTLLCESGVVAAPFGLGMPFMPPKPTEEITVPRGSKLLLGPAGLLVTWTRDKHDDAPTLTISPHAVAIDPAAYAK